VSVELALSHIQFQLDRRIKIGRRNQCRILDIPLIWSLYAQRTKRASMRNVPRGGRSLGSRRTGLRWLAPSWAAVLVVSASALGCAGSLSGTGSLDDTREPDARSGDLQDASLNASDAQDAPLDDEAATTNTADTSEEEDASADGEWEADNPDDVAIDVTPDERGSDAFFDGSSADDASVDTTSGDAPSDGRIVCGFAPPAPGGTCPAVCNEGCLGGVCQIGCRGEQECKGATIECPPGFSCEINCAAKQSCDNAVLICPDDYACRLTCAGEQSCKALELTCGSGPCQLTCLGSNQSCDATVVNCSAQACTASCPSPDNSPSLNCGQSCDCRPCP
jgi:hypothetical protein